MQLCIEYIISNIYSHNRLVRDDGLQAGYITYMYM